jgi:hypothetical protein
VTKRWTAQDAEEVRVRYLAGASCRELAPLYGTTPQTVYRFLERSGVEMRPLGQTAVHASLEELRIRYLAGESLQDLAAGTGASYKTIGRRLRAAGVEMRPRYERTEAARRKIGESHRADIPEDRLRELHAQGMSCREMGTILGFSSEAIRDRLVELGLPRLPAKARPQWNHFWQGGYAVDEEGYILRHCPDHPNAVKGYVRQHRLVMEKILGRYLTSEEVVDHKNRDTSDNNPENLELYATNADHLAATLAGRKKLPPEERERLRQEAVLRARQRVAAILAASGNGAGQSP